MTRSLFVAFFVLAAVAPSAAQQRPLKTEDPETIGAGRVLVEAGVGYDRDVYYPVSGLRGNLLTLPSFGVSIGISSIAEIQIDTGFYQKLSITERTLGAPFANLLDLSGTTTADVDDIHIGTKVRFVGESANRPAIGAWFATRLPNATNESGLGTDLQDFSTALTFGKTVSSIRVVANVGMQILASPTRTAAQDDMLIYSLSVARAISPRGEVVGEFVGRANFANIATPGAEDRGLLRFGARYTVSTVRLDTGLVLGLTSRDPEIGVTAGLTWVFNAFKIP